MNRRPRHRALPQPTARAVTTLASIARWRHRNTSALPTAAGRTSSSSARRRRERRRSSTLSPSTHKSSRRGSKSPNHFSTVAPPPERRAFFPSIHDEREYLALFAAARADQVAGEASTSYLWDPESGGRIHSVAPGARIIAMLRDPVERAWSHYLNDVREGVETRSFDQAISEDAANPDGRWGNAGPTSARLLHPPTAPLPRDLSAHSRSLLRGVRAGRPRPSRPHMRLPRRYAVRRRSGGRPDVQRVRPPAEPARAGHARPRSGPRALPGPLRRRESGRSSGGSSRRRAEAPGARRRTDTPRVPLCRRSRGVARPSRPRRAVGQMSNRRFSSSSTTPSLAARTTRRFGSRARWPRGWETIVLLPDEPGNAAERLQEAGIRVITAPLVRIRAIPSPRVQMHTATNFRHDIQAIRRAIEDEGDGPRASRRACERASGVRRASRGGPRCVAAPRYPYAGRSPVRPTSRCWRGTRTR